jgi:hypothetical protein
MGAEQGTPRHVLILEANASDARESRARPDDGPVPGGTATILLAEAEEAVALLSTHRTEVGLAIVDVVMPTVGGREAAARMRELCPAPAWSRSRST